MNITLYKYIFPVKTSSIRWYFLAGENTKERENKYHDWKTNHISPNKI